LSPERICPQCASPVGEEAYCGTCGLDLRSVSSLPPRNEWQRPSPRSERKAREAEALRRGVCPSCGQPVGSGLHCQNCGAHLPINRSWGKGWFNLALGVGAVMGLATALASGSHWYSGFYRTWSLWDLRPTAAALITVCGCVGVGLSVVAFLLGSQRQSKSSLVASLPFMAAAGGIVGAIALVTAIASSGPPDVFNSPPSGTSAPGLTGIAAVLMGVALPLLFVISRQEPSVIPSNANG
jgi:hypothetical protein